MENGNQFAINTLNTRPENEWPFYWHAFGDLATERQVGFGSLGAIPQSTIRTYARDEQLTSHETSVLLYVIRALDTRQRELAAERAEKRAKQAGK